MSCAHATPGARGPARAIPFQYIQASGSYRELGRAVGEGAREQVHAALAFFRDNLQAMTGGQVGHAEALRRATAYAEHARRWLPDQAEELEGLAEGADVPFAELMVPNLGEELTMAVPSGVAPPAAGSAYGGDHCTAVAVSVGGRHIVGHNMDWYVVDAVNNVFFDLTAPGGTRIMGIAGAPYLLMLGMNSHGVASVSNSVHSNDDRVGVPNAFVRRSTLEAATLEAARARGLLAARARGTNHFLADAGGRLWDLETSATADAFVDHSGDGFMVHTNHYVAPAMAGYDTATREESQARLAHASRLLREGLARGDDPMELVAAVLRSHDPKPLQSVCGHPDPRQPVAEQGMTVSSMICDLDERRIHVCAGPPCENPYHTYGM